METIRAGQPNSWAKKDGEGKGSMLKKEEIQIRDPFVLPLKDTGEYYLFGTTDENCWDGPGEGFNCYRSTDLENWDGPFPAFRPPKGFWANTNFWAPEVHIYDGRYYMFASFKAANRYRGTQILVAAKPEGPYLPLTDGPITPVNWGCLDGTFHVDEKGNPWIVFCHEWLQIRNGAMYAMRLSRDLRSRASVPVFLFSATEAPWAVPVAPEHDGLSSKFPGFVTDGPFIFSSTKNELFMLWSSFGKNGYAMGLARSSSNRVEGPWTQFSEPLWGKDGGHGMVFKAFDGRLFLTLHKPNRTPYERPCFAEILETDEGLQLR